jgi:decaprenylphospho-beta-D-ribofuranose 2-oxidase
VRQIGDNLRRCTDFVSFDGSIRISARHRRPDRYRHLDETVDPALIARGGGYAYSAASFGASSCALEMTSFNRLLEFDPATSALRVEAGARIIDVIVWATRHGLQLPIIPGYPLITVGGCIAGDVHGKNPWRDGTFSDWVRAVTLFHPDKGYISVTPETDPTLFEITCGGFGLTGVIIDATLELTTLPSTDVDLISQPVRTLAEAVDRLSELNEDFGYSWHDATPGRSFGRGVVTSGRWVAGKLDVPSLRYRPMNAGTRAVTPFSLWNPLTIRWANALFYRLNGRWLPRRRLNLLDAAFPLARHRAYLGGFGRIGLRECQLLLEEAQIKPFIRALEHMPARDRHPLIMASLKRFRGRQRSLSPNGLGFLIALDFFPGKAGDRMMAEIDNLMLEMGGQPNLSKDSRIGREVAARSIRHYAAFAEKLRRFDPSRRFRSELSERIGL